MGLFYQSARAHRIGEVTRLVLTVLFLALIGPLLTMVGITTWAIYAFIA